MKTVSTLCLVFVLACAVVAGETVTSSRLAHTYSIIAYDSVTGEFGAAVQSHYFRVADVIWAEPGVGVVATQSLVDFAYGPLGLAMMKNGKTATQSLAGLITSDPGSSGRQVAMIDRFGNVATHTGDKCISEAGHRQGKCYSVQANLMLKNTVWDAMANAFESTKGDIAERLMAALEAAQAEGGDIRGMQSAAILVVTRKPTGMSWRDRLIDLRVDDSPQPLVELKRLLNIQRAYKHEDRGDELISEGKVAEAEIEYEKAASLAPNIIELKFWHAASLATNNQLEKALPIFKEVFKVDSSYRTLVPRLVKAELLPKDDALIQKILAQ